MTRPRHGGRPPQEPSSPSSRRELDTAADQLEPRPDGLERIRARISAGAGASKHAAASGGFLADMVRRWNAARGGQDGKAPASGGNGTGGTGCSARPWRLPVPCSPSASPWRSRRSARPSSSSARRSGSPLQLQSNSSTAGGCSPEWIGYPRAARRPAASARAVVGRPEQRQATACPPSTCRPPRPKSATSANRDAAERVPGGLGSSSPTDSTSSSPGDSPTDARQDRTATATRTASTPPPPPRQGQRPCSARPTERVGRRRTAQAITTPSCVQLRHGRPRRPSPGDHATLPPPAEPPSKPVSPPSTPPASRGPVPARQQHRAAAGESDKHRGSATTGQTATGSASRPGEQRAGSAEQCRVGQHRVERHRSAQRRPGSSTSSSGPAA